MSIYNVNLTNIYDLKILNGGGFHGDPVVRSPSFYCRGHGFDFRLVNQNPAKGTAKNKLMNSF